ncbi:MAG: DMT family transporter [Aeromicrobium sp.]|uniref:DMT family transporter n=1 Tax=Aeromicrobium sp. TaxID=1871063 RepID=UPI0039E4844E
MAAVPFMMLGGALVAVQSRINGALAEQVGEGLRASALTAVVSFGSGLAIITAVVVALPAGRRSMRRIFDARSVKRLRWYEMLGGLCGAFFVASQGLAVGTIGVGLFIVAFTAGQSLGSLAVDHWGLGPGGRRPASVGRAVAASFAIAAVLVKAVDQIDAGATWLTAGLAALALVAGVTQAVQQAVNGRVSAVAGPLGTTWNNFAVGTAALLVLLAASFLTGGRIDGLPTEPWYYAGGLVGIGFIVVAAVAVHRHGVLVLGLCMIAGQVVAAELLDLFDPTQKVGLLGVVGGVVAVAGVVLAFALSHMRDTLNG